MPIPSRSIRARAVRAVQLYLAIDNAVRAGCAPDAHDWADAYTAARVWSALELAHSSDPLDGALVAALRAYAHVERLHHAGDAIPAHAWDAAYQAAQHALALAVDSEPTRIPSEGGSSAGAPLPARRSSAGAHAYQRRVDPRGDLNRALRRLLGGTAAYALLPDDYVSWFAGGCRILAEAMCHWLDLDESALWAVGTSGVPVQHVVVRVGTYFLDGDGISFAETLLRRWRRREGLQGAWLHPLGDTTPPVDIPTDIETSRRIAEFLGRWRAGAAVRRILEIAD